MVRNVDNLEYLSAVMGLANDAQKVITKLDGLIERSEDAPEVQGVFIVIREVVKSQDAVIRTFVELDQQETEMVQENVAKLEEKLEENGE